MKRMLSPVIKEVKEFNCIVNASPIMEIPFHQLKLLKREVKFIVYKSWFNNYKAIVYTCDVWKQKKFIAIKNVETFTNKRMAKRQVAIGSFIKMHENDIFLVDSAIAGEVGDKMVTKFLVIAKVDELTSARKSLFESFVENIKYTIVDNKVHQI